MKASDREYKYIPRTERVTPVAIVCKYNAHILFVLKEYNLSQLRRVVTIIGEGRVYIEL